VAGGCPFPLRSSKTVGKPGAPPAVPSNPNSSSSQGAEAVGVAPFTRQSGQWCGKSFIGGGRASVRKALFMGAMVARRHMIMLYATSALVALLLLIVPAHAIEVTVLAMETADTPAIVLLEGQIEQGDDERFRLATAAITKAIVFFISPGGLVLTGVEIGREIRLKKFMTAVADYTFCTSSCALAWMGGDRRFMGPQARIGFHSTHNPGSGIRSVTGNTIVGEYFAQLGLSYVTIGYATRADPRSMIWLTTDDAQRYEIDVQELPAWDNPFHIWEWAWHGLLHQIKTWPVKFKTPSTVVPSVRVPATPQRGNDFDGRPAWRAG
jgi:hypothetical protein